MIARRVFPRLQVQRRKQTRVPRQSNTGRHGLGFVVALLVVTSGCVAPSPNERTVSDGWEVAAPVSEGFDADSLAAIVEFIEWDTRQDFRGLVVARNGKLVAEHYFNGHGRGCLQDMRSAGKSITSALVGIAIADGLLPDVDAPVLPLFASYLPARQDAEAKATITMKHLLTMTSGLNANADDDSTPGYEDRMWESDDWVRFGLDVPMANTPGSTWMYASVNSFLAGAAVEEASGLSLAAFAEERLFGPLGIENYHWRTTPNGRTVAQGNLSMRARDMAKIGQLYLDGGRWQGQQVLPEAWVEASVEALYPTPWANYDGYGYAWYTHTLTVAQRAFSYVFASGNGGNKIYVFPDEQIVVVTQSAAYNTRYGQGRSLETLRRVLAAVTA